MKNPILIAFTLAGFAALGGSAATVEPAVPAPAAPVAPPANKKPEPNFVFVINCTPPGPGKAGDNLHFEIIVASRTGKFSPDAEGTLEVYDPSERILTCNLQTGADGKNLKYVFDLAPAYLDKARFTFKCTGTDEKGKPTADVLWVHVKDFVKPNLL